MQTQSGRSQYKRGCHHFPAGQKLCIPHTQGCRLPTSFCFGPAPGARRCGLRPRGSRVPCSAGEAVAADPAPAQRRPPRRPRPSPRPLPGATMPTTKTARRPAHLKRGESLMHSSNSTVMAAEALTGTRTTASRAASPVAALCPAAVPPAPEPGRPPRPLSPPGSVAQVPAGCHSQGASPKCHSRCHLRGASPNSLHARPAQPTAQQSKQDPLKQMEAGPRQAASGRQLASERRQCVRTPALGIRSLRNSPRLKKTAWAGRAGRPRSE